MSWQEAVFAVSPLPFTVVSLWAMSLTLTALAALTDMTFNAEIKRLKENA